MSYSGGSFLDTLTSLVATLLIFSLMVAVSIFLLVLLLVMIALGVVAYLILRRWVIPFLQQPFTAPPRLFGAPATVQWMLAYEYWLFLLEQVTGIEFNSTPFRILIGCLIISLTPAVVIGLPLAVISPTGAWLQWLTIGGIAVGLFTGFKFPSGGAGWFESLDGNDEGTGGFILGDGPQ
jgi:hypothetical protein